MKLDNFNKKLSGLEAEVDKLEQTDGYVRAIKHLIEAIKLKAAYIERDNEIKAKKGKEFFKAKDGVKPETIVEVEKEIIKD